MYQFFGDFYNKYKGVLHAGKKNIVQQEWIDDVEEELGFKLPESYKWWCKEFEYFAFGDQFVKCITSPEHRDECDIDILYTRRTDLENETIEANQLTVFEPDDEIYYFKIEKGIENNEYKVYIKDFYNDTEDIYANNFLEFLENKIKEYK